MQSVRMSPHTEMHKYPRARAVENLGSCYHMFACRYSTCCFVGQVTTCLLLCCYSTAIFSRQMGTRKGMRRQYTKDLRNMLIYSSSAGLHCSTYLHEVKNGLVSKPRHKQGQKNRYDPLWGTAPSGEKQVCPFLC